jgi:hypothetical protein
MPDLLIYFNSKISSKREIFFAHTGTPMINGITRQKKFPFLAAREREI